MQLSYITAEMHDNFAKALEAGARVGVEVVSLRAPVWDSHLENLDDDQVRRICDLLAARGMRPGMLLSPVGKCNIADAARVTKNGEILKRTFDTAHRLGSNQVRVFPFRAPAQVAFGPSQLDGYFDQIVERWTPWVEWAAAAEIVLCFEWVGSTLVLTSQQMRRVIDALGSPAHVGAIWEIDVSAQAGEDPSQGYPQLQDLVRDVHIKRFDGGATRPQYLDALRLLQRSGYAGPLTIEHWGGEVETLAGISAVRALLEDIS